MTLKNPKKLHPLNIQLQIRLLGRTDLFGHLHTKNIVKNLVFFDKVEKIHSYAPRLITIYFVIILFQA